MSGFVYCAFRLVFGTLYPAYASFKAVKTKNVKEYVSMTSEVVLSVVTSPYHACTGVLCRPVFVQNTPIT